MWPLLLSKVGVCPPKSGLFHFFQAILGQPLQFLNADIKKPRNKVGKSGHNFCLFFTTQANAELGKAVFAEIFTIDIVQSLVLTTARDATHCLASRTSRLAVRSNTSVTAAIPVKHCRDEQGSHYVFHCHLLSLFFLKQNIWLMLLTSLYLPGQVFVSLAAVKQRLSKDTTEVVRAVATKLASRAFVCKILIGNIASRERYVLQHIHKFSPIFINDKRPYYRPPISFTRSSRA